MGTHGLFFGDNIGAFILHETPAVRQPFIRGQVLKENQFQIDDEPTIFFFIAGQNYYNYSNIPPLGGGIWNIIERSLSL